MMSDELPKVIRTGEFNLGGVIIKCHNLDNGQRVIDKESLEALFCGDSKISETEIEAFCRWIKGGR
jgi:hypothetical protein